MLAKKPEIIIFTNTRNEQLVKEVCAGIEEEGLLYRCVAVTENNANLLAHEAASEATIGVGISVVGEVAVLTAENLTPENPIYIFRDGDKERARNMGKNAARFIKKLPLSV